MNVRKKIAMPKKDRECFTISGADHSTKSRDLKVRL